MPAVAETGSTMYAYAPARRQNSGSIPRAESSGCSASRSAMTGSEARTYPRDPAPLKAGAKSSNKCFRAVTVLLPNGAWHTPAFAHLQ